jgi:hypothetical protein
MVSKDNMVTAYVEQVRSNLEQTKAQVVALEQHLKECEEAIAEPASKDAN